LGIFPNIILDTIHTSITQLLYNNFFNPISFKNMENHQILLAFNATMFNLKQMSYEKNNCKDIVVFGTNLGLTINFDFYSKQIREMIELPNFQFSTIIGLYLSNG